MTRGEEICNAAENFGYSVAAGNPARVHLSRGFIEGAKWADTHPILPWISVKSSNPSDYKELHRTFNGILIRDELRTVPVIARAVNGDNVIHIMAYMYLNRDTNLWEWVSLNKPIGKIYSITHWMQIPEL